MGMSVKYMTTARDSDTKKERIYYSRREQLGIILLNDLN